MVSVKYGSPSAKATAGWLIGSSVRPVADNATACVGWLWMTLITSGRAL